MYEFEHLNIHYRTIIIESGIYKIFLLCRLRVNGINIVYHIEPVNHLGCFDSLIIRCTRLILTKLVVVSMSAYLYWYYYFPFPQFYLSSKIIQWSKCCSNLKKIPQILIKLN